VAEGVTSFDWWFRDRTTGRTVIAQPPNLTLGIWLVISVGRWVFSPEGTLDTWLRAVATGALVLWALDELVRGVNPWRRTLGAVVLVWQVATLVR
jgi:hypothetical protein